MRNPYRKGALKTYYSKRYRKLGSRVPYFNAVVVVGLLRKGSIMKHRLLVVSLFGYLKAEGNLTRAETKQRTPT